MCLFSRAHVFCCCVFVCLEVPFRILSGPYVWLPFGEPWLSGKTVESVQFSLISEFLLLPVRVFVEGSPVGEFR